ncbi:MAG: hypothetical protein K2N16_02290 [Muribaculaceae bacterium]|nr:hypothetical protein [Muribaculaceae bacterium]
MYITKRDLCRQGTASVAYSGASDFADGADSDDEYGYDANGNVVRDDNRGISSIKHNPLNLPQEVRFADGHYILQAYSADGRLLRRITGESLTAPVVPPRPWLGLSSAPGADPAAITWPGIGDKPILPDTSMLVKVALPDTLTYAGAFVLKGRKLDRALASSGYIKGDTAYYFLRDHQGSVRQVVSGADGSVVQENQYYPYGGLHGESSAQALSASNGASASGPSL